MPKRTNTFPTISSLADTDTFTGVQGGVLDIQATVATVRANMQTILDAGGYFPTNTVEAALQQLGASLAAAPTAYQPLDDDLTNIALLATKAFGRSLLTAVDAATARTLLSAQPLDSDLTSIAALATTTYGRSLLTLANAAGALASIGALSTAGGTITGNLTVVGSTTLSGPVSVPIPTLATQAARTSAVTTATGRMNINGFEIGDTGLRELSANLLNGWTATDFHFRRVGYTVFCRISALTATASTSTTVIPIPTGFGGFVTGMCHTTAAVPVMRRLAQSGNNIVVPNKAATDVLYWQGSWVATEAWPTTLPGVLMADGDPPFVDLDPEE